jgi:hypothetical protein
MALAISKVLTFDRDKGCGDVEMEFVEGHHD